MSFQHPAWWLRLSPSHLDICLGVPKFTIAILQQTKTIVGPIRSGYSTHMAQKASFTNHLPPKNEWPIEKSQVVQVDGSLAPGFWVIPTSTPCPVGTASGVWCFQWHPKLLVVQGSLAYAWVSQFAARNGIMGHHLEEVSIQPWGSQGWMVYDKPKTEMDDLGIPKS